MRITDYESTRSLNDVCLVLTPSEAEELADYLRVLADKPNLRQVYLSEIAGSSIERELTVRIDRTVSRA